MQSPKPSHLTVCNLLVDLHFLLAAEALATEVTEVERSDMAPLVDHQVVGLGERSVAPTTVVCLSDGTDLK